jgi:predicted NBD/HSP70 family sugar kinase
MDQLNDIGAASRRETRRPAQREPHSPRGNRQRMTGLLSSSMVGSVNRGRVLQLLFDRGPTSRADLARLADVSRTTISGIVQPLIDSGVLIEGGPVPGSSGVGKPARPLRFSPDARPICGVLLMPDAVQACIVTLEGAIEVEHRAALPPRGEPVEVAMAVLDDVIARTLHEARAEPLGIGVAVGGMVDTNAGMVVKINLAPALDGYPLVRHLREQFNLPARLDHHPRALLVGDRWFGAGRNVSEFAVVYTGEVLGGALYVDGHLFRGAAGAGGELGHTFVQLDGELCRCGRRGCWDTIATLSWLRREAARIGLPDSQSIDSDRLVASLDHPGAADLLDRYARNVAVGIANLQQTVAPNTFILHGDVVLGGDRLISAIARHVRAMVPPRPGTVIDILAGDSGDRAALRGAAGLVLSDLLQFEI